MNWDELKEKAKEKEALEAKEAFWTRKIVKIVIASLTGLLLLTGIGMYGYYRYAMSPVDVNNHEKVEVLVPIGSTSRDIAYLLKENNIIKNADIFRFYMRSKNVGNLQAGTYEFSQDMDADQVIEQLKTGGKPIYVDADKKITIIEGMQLTEIADVIAENTPYSAEEVLKRVNSDEFINQMQEKYPSLLEGIHDHEGVRYKLEGYLFPATYDYLVGMSLDDLLGKMVETANLRFYSLKEQVDAHWMTYHQILSLASIVEREGVTEEDRKLIAGVFFNRLEAEMPLQSDITVLYALNEHKEFVTLSDIEVDSPYNLYANTGLTPGPVNSPSFEAIRAVLSPTWTDNYYFVADLDTGNVYYSATLEEHEALVEEYVNKRQRRIEGEQTSSQETTLNESSEMVDEASE